MKLLVDMGNSTLKWSTISEGVLSQVSTLDYHSLQSQLRSQWQTLEKPKSVIVSCVADGQYWQLVCQLSKSLWSMTPQRVLSPAEGNGVANAYHRPEELGSDRWAVLVAAHALYNRDVCIVDCGTAMNIELLKANGRHLGGVIVPGVDMMQSSLHINTAGISQNVSHSNTDQQPQYWGQDTQSCIIKGSWQALAGTVKQVYGQFKKQAQQPICVLCGGAAGQLARYLDMEVEYQPELVFKGLAVIAGEKLAL